MSQSIQSVTPQERVRVRDTLDAQDLIAVANGDALALEVRGYYDAAACGQLATALLGAKKLWTTYAPETGAGGIGTIGDSLFGCLGQELCPTYFESGKVMHQAIRTAVLPWMLPIDRAQLELDHRWPHGANLLRISDQAAFSGLVRMFRAGGEALPHTDRADWDFPAVETAALLTQLFVNVYLSKTDTGGAIRLWDRKIETMSEYDDLRLQPGHYALNPTAIGPPILELDVPVGSLLIADARKVHAVTQCSGNGTRLSVSSFIGYAGEHEPLLFFS